MSSRRCNVIAKKLASASDVPLIDTEEDRECYIPDVHIEKDREFCIPKVPRHLRKINEEAYTQFISIGPYHYGKIELADMEKHKIRYMKAFYERITRGGQKQLENFIIKNEEKIRRQYAEPPEFSGNKFVEIILFDVVFIIELFLMVRSRAGSDFLLNELWLGAIRRDLLLIENQLPYFTLEGLYNLAASFTTKDKVSDFRISFSDLSSMFFQLRSADNIRLHKKQAVSFTDLYRYDLVKIPEYPKRRGIKSLECLPSAVKLKKSGVMFKPGASEYLVDIELVKKIGPLSFGSVELRIPCIIMTDNTECLIRNLMVLEQCLYPLEMYICSYIDLMDSLINTENDVDLLVEREIIYNPSGDNSVIANMFNKLRQQIPRSQSSYYFKIHEGLRDHYNSRWNHAMTTLRSVYFCNPWRGTATVVAIILPLLTLIQTVFSVLQLLLA